MSGFQSRKRDRGSSWSSKKQKVMRSAEEELESKLGFDLFSEGDKRLGWLLTFASVRFCTNQFLPHLVFHFRNLRFFLVCLVTEIAKVKGGIWDFESLSCVWSHLVMESWIKLLEFCYYSWAK